MIHTVQHAAYVAFLATIATLCVLILLRTPVPAECAPAPHPRPAKQITPADLIGEWAITWMGEKGVCQFGKDGYFHCLGWGGDWVGQWTLAAGRLWVQEAKCDEQGIPSGQTIAWRVSLTPGRLSGTLDGGGDFSLTPVRKAKPDA